MKSSGKVVVRTLLVVILLGSLVWDLFQQSTNDRPFDWTGPLICGGMAVVMIPLIWRVTGNPERQDRIFADAKIGVGTIVSANSTGSSINDDPQIEFVLDVDTPEGRTFRASLREYTEVTDLVHLVPGAAVPVEYLPDGRIRFHRALDEDRVQDALYEMRVRQGKMTPQQVRVAREGLHAQAVVMSAEPTGEISGGEAVIRLHVRVARPDGTTFDSIRELPLPPVALPGLQPGSVVEARYLPHDESCVSVQTRMR